MEGGAERGGRHRGHLVCIICICLVCSWGTLDHLRLSWWLLIQIFRDIFIIHWLKKIALLYFFAFFRLKTDQFFMYYIMSLSAAMYLLPIAYSPNYVKCRQGKHESSQAMK